MIKPVDEERKKEERDNKSNRDQPSIKEGQSSEPEKDISYDPLYLIFGFLIIVLLSGVGYLIASNYFESEAKHKQEKKEGTFEGVNKSKSEEKFKAPESVQDNLTYRVVDKSEDTVDQDRFRINRAPTVITEINSANLTKAGPYFFHDEAVYYGNKFSTSKKGVNGSTQEGYNLRQIKQAKTSSFDVFKKDTRYARNEKNVYFVQTKPFSRMLQLHVIQAGDPETFVPRIVTQFDVSQGNTIQGWIAKDKDHVFFAGEVIPKADPDTFKITESPRVSKDKDHVYLLNDDRSYEILEGADPRSYEILIDEHRGALYAADRNTFFVNDCSPEAVDVETVEWLEKYPAVFEDKKGRFSVNYQDSSCSIERQ